MMITEILNEIKEPLAIAGLILIAVVHPTDAVVTGVIGALAGIIGIKTAGK